MLLRRLPVGSHSGLNNLGMHGQCFLCHNSLCQVMESFLHGVLIDRFNPSISDYSDCLLSLIFNKVRRTWMWIAAGGTGGNQAPTIPQHRRCWMCWCWDVHRFCPPLPRIKPIHTDYSVLSIQSAFARLCRFPKESNRLRLAQPRIGVIRGQIRGSR